MVGIPLRCEFHPAKRKRHGIYLYDCLPRTGVMCIFVNYRPISHSFTLFFAIVYISYHQHFRTVVQ